LASWNHWPISLIGIIGFGLIASSASAISSAHWLIGLVSLGLAAALIAAKTIGILLLWLKQKASHGVAALQISATKITNAAASYYHAVSSLHVCSFVREKMCWWLALAKKKMWLWIASFGDSYNDEVLQYGKQLFSLRLPQMTKYCVMRECDNILSGYISVVTPVFSQQDGIYGFKFPKRFLEISSRDLTLFFLLSILIKLPS
jgi:hypothetical protein